MLNDKDAVPHLHFQMDIKKAGSGEAGSGKAGSVRSSAVETSLTLENL
jgi:hypothetical protein